MLCVPFFTFTVRGPLREVVECTNSLRHAYRHGHPERAQTGDSQGGARLQKVATWRHEPVRRSANLYDYKGDPDDLL